MATLKADPSAPTAAPPPPPPNEMPRPPPQSQSIPKTQARTAESNARDYYGYLFNKDKSPTPVLDALLRAIARHISDNIGDRSVASLNPKKLATFYRTVGGDYDSLFIACPNKSISYIWQALGVQHTLQPTENPYEAPSIPALTLRGFVRWEAIQLLLEPQEHVPFIQYAVRHWGLVNPDTGKPFPVDLPREAFPAESDSAIDAWHKECARRLRDEATPQDETPPRRPASDPRIHHTFAHVRNPQTTGAVPRSRPEMDYFQRQRPVAYTHVSGTNYAGTYFAYPTTPRRKMSRSSGNNSSSSTSPGSPPRRRSRSDARRAEMEEPRVPNHLDPHTAQVPRRSSKTRRYSVSPSDSNSDVSPRPSSKTRARGPVPPPPSVRRMPVATPVAPAAPTHSRRNEVRSDDTRRMSLPAEIKQKFTSFIGGSSDRQRSSSREKRHVSNVPPNVHFRREKPSRLSRSASGESYPSDDDSSPEVVPIYSRRERERERVRDRAIEKEREREREREEEIDRLSRQDRAYLRPTVPRRASSHTDADRRTREYTWERRDRDRSTDIDREGRRVMTADERESRDRRRYKERGQSPILTGVSGRRYPGEPSWK
ncbi:uncharacterized protein F4822DRAFT_440127 [Hypoxylon trugodes]|uniref:uncharacterized protein n=1 Tax=Hypoxylon trugodes TaxID=326681 RepID=UPI00219B0B60|nr:uncharacterized protein F4822DRAFT_440127 [Hypoxylon trugodes]KAI1383881.1 hypothetical protein F4822DRAFT_440127 [Hypoxylon trugodes]